MKFNYVIKGEAVVKPLISEEIDKYLSLASVKEIAKYIPNIDTAKNVDLLPIAFDAFVANRVNKNDDVCNSEVAVGLAKLFVNKPIDIEHKREKVIGFITNYAFTKFGTDEPLSESDVLKLNEPFNVTLGGVLWKLVQPNVIKLVEESGDPANENYGKVSASWEVGFMDYAVAAIQNGSKNLADAKIITDEKEIESVSGYMKANGGKGSKGDDRLYRLITGDALSLGIGLTGTPAAEVKGIATPITNKEDTKAEECMGSEIAIKDLKSGEHYIEKCSCGEVISQCRCGGKDKTVITTPKGCPKCKEKENTISQVSINNVNTKGTSIDMKITKIEDITDEALKQVKASDMTEFVKDQLRIASEAFVKEKNELNDKLTAAAKDAEDSKRIQAELQAKVEEVSKSLKSLQDEKEARARQDAFNSRMAVLDTEFDLGDSEREVIASDIANLDDTAFDGYKKKLDVLLAAKKKNATTPKGNQSMQEQKSTPDNGNKKTGPDPDSDTGNDKKPTNEKVSKASDAQATVDNAIDNSQKTPTTVPATTQATEESLVDKYAKAFAVENLISDIDLSELQSK